MKSKLLLWCVFALALFGLEIQSDYEQAHKKALREGKTLVVFLTKKECPFCNTQLRKLLTDTKIRNLLEHQSVFTVIVYNTASSYPIEMLYSDTYPSLFFLDANELFLCETLRGEIDTAAVAACLKP